MMLTKVTIARGEDRSVWPTYTVPYEPGARVAQILHTLFETLDGTLAYRTNFCKRGSCGLCMIMLNNKAVKACKAPVESEMLIEPLPTETIRDVVTRFNKPHTCHTPD